MSYFTPAETMSIILKQRDKIIINMKNTRLMSIIKNLTSIVMRINAFLCTYSNQNNNPKWMFLKFNLTLINQLKNT